ncbi:hypothetical protein [Haemophilus parahaemolyticus]|uniref:hypothetical protein n=1 Tax=Haemophilus parahaemolyticus TaxID=735 RepID=UPI0024926BD3|nr:hypothetical protein [Haemophilus parahaemolyticus]
MKLFFNLTTNTFSPVYDDSNIESLPDGIYLVEDEKIINGISESLTNGGVVWVERGKICYSGKAPSEFHVFNMDTKRFELSSEKQTAYLAERKETLLTTLANRADQLKNGLLVGYPQTEIESFYRQEKEALAKQANPKAETPMLEQIARVRGVPLDVLIEKVIEKSNQFAVAIGIIIGKRQQFEDRLVAIETLEALEQLEQEVNAWQFQAS